MEKYEAQGMDRHSVEALLIIIKACQAGGNRELLKEAKEALLRKVPPNNQAQPSANNEGRAPALRTIN
jgi:hypothetical protein